MLHSLVGTMGHNDRIEGWLAHDLTQCDTSGDIRITTTICVVLSLCTKHFVCINSFDFHRSPVEFVLGSSLFMHRVTEGCKG